MAFLWFILAVIFFILWLNAKQKPESDRYNQGFWDGYRSLGDAIRQAIENKSIKPNKKLDELIDVGRGAPNTDVESDTPELSGDEVGDELEVEAEDDVPFLQQYARSTTSATEVDPEVALEIEPELKLDPAELEAEKARITLRNLNIVLYAASFLLVAAAAAFVAAAMPSFVKIAGLIIVVILFYGLGLAIHARSERLRPAAIAFVGTGLAILPFVGVALTLIGGMGAAASWWITSIVGILFYVVATIRLNSQVLSYISLAFVLSLASSSVAVVSLPLVWYFVALIGVSLLATLCSLLRPNWLPKVFSQPVEATGQIVTPLALLATLYVSDKMSVHAYEIVFTVATLHYFVAWLQVRSYGFEILLRCLGYLTLTLFIWDWMHHDGFLFSLSLQLLTVGGILLSLRRLKDTTRKYEAFFTGASILVLAANTFYPYGLGLHVQTSLSVIHSFIVIGTSILAAKRFRHAGWLYAALGASLWLPFTVSNWIATQDGKWLIEVVSFAGLSFAVSFALRHPLSRRNAPLRALLLSAYLLYVTLLVITGCLSDNTFLTGLSFALIGVSGIILSYAFSDPLIEGTAVIAGLISIPLWVWHSSIGSRWHLIVSVIVMSILLAAGSFVHHLRAERMRRNGLVMFMAVIGLSLLFVDRSIETMRASTLLLTAGALGLLWVRLCAKDTILLLLTRIAYLIYGILAWIMALGTGNEWLVGVYGILVLFYETASHIEKQWRLSLVTCAALIGMLNALWSVSGGLEIWRWAGVLGVASILFYGAAYVYQKRFDSERAWVMQIALWTSLAGMSILRPCGTEGRWFAAVSLVCLAGTIILRVMQASTSQHIRSLVLSGAAFGFALIGILGWWLQYDTLVFAIALFLSGVFWIASSYTVRSASIEGVGLGILVASAAVWLLDVNGGDWYASSVVGSGVFLTVLAYLIHLKRGEVERRRLALSIGMLVFAGLVFNIASTPVIQQYSLLALLLGSVGALVIRTSRPLSSGIKTILSAGYVTYLLLAWLFALQEGGGWLVAVYGITTVVLWVASHIERLSFLTAIGNAVLLFGLIYTWNWLGWDQAWMLAASLWIVAAVSYLQSWIYRGLNDITRYWTGLFSTWITLSVVIIWYLIADTPHEIAAAITLVVAALTVALQGYLSKQRAVMELGLYLGIAGLQRLGVLLVPGVPFILYAHLWATILLSTSIWRRDSMTRPVVAATILTLSTASSALTHGGWYQLLFLVEQITLLVIGALARKQWALWWGVAGTTGAVLYFIKDYVYLWLGLLGLILIALVIWRLRKLGKKA
ncbi:MAG TPA: hypothetical protein VJ841_03140 [Candidatus Saccharimonadales bacterium]|nr:hypothetical protein [Candidatus Saccharimonadales bacterium]